MHTDSSRDEGSAGDEMILTSLNAAYEDFAIPRDPSLVVGTVMMRWCGH